MRVSKKLSKQELRRRERNQGQVALRLFWSAAIVVGLIAIGYSVLQLSKPQLGISIPVMSSARHIQIGEQHEVYNSDPPTSGPHYAEPAQAGFYNEALPDEQLVHNLEHGYVIIWYNCTSLGGTACQNFKTQIQAVMDQAGPVSVSGSNKLIAVPRPSLVGSLAASSWGRLYQPDAFNADELLLFIKDFRNKAPEPGAP